MKPTPFNAPKRPYYIRPVFDVVHGLKYGIFRADRLMANGRPYGQNLRAYSSLDEAMNKLYPRFNPPRI